MPDEQVIAAPADSEQSDNTADVEGAEPSETEVDETGDTPAEPVKENRVQKRIDEITRARRQAEQDAEYWRKVATGEIRQSVAPAPVQEALPPGLAPKPRLDDFEDYDQYTEALGEWAAEKTLAKREFAEQQKKANEAKQAVAKTYQERVEVARTKYPDWDEVVAVNDVNLLNSTIDAIVESEQGPDISYHLLTNPSEAARIKGLSPIQQIKEIARLEAKFSSAPTAPVKRVSQAPTPINALGGSDKGIMDIDKLDGDEWAKAERERVRKLGRRY